MIRELDSEASFEKALCTSLCWNLSFFFFGLFDLVELLYLCSGVARFHARYFILCFKSCSVVLDGRLLQLKLVSLLVLAVGMLEHDPSHYPKSLWRPILYRFQLFRLTLHTTSQFGGLLFDYDLTQVYQFCCLEMEMSFSSFI